MNYLPSLPELDEKGIKKFPIGGEEELLPDSRLIVLEKCELLDPVAGNSIKNVNLQA